MGEMQKGSEKALDRDADKKQVYSRRIFYLGKDVLYYISKDSTLEAAQGVSRVPGGQCDPPAASQDFQRARPPG